MFAARSSGWIFSRQSMSDAASAVPSSLMEPALVSATVSSSDHGRMKPHPSIFNALLGLMDAAPAESVMVGDSVRHDVEDQWHRENERGERPVQGTAIVELPRRG